MKNEIIDHAATYVKRTLINANESGHDWQHTYRVWQNTIFLAQKTPCDQLVVELGALFHDIADAKFHSGDETIGGKVTKSWLTKQNVTRDISDKVVFIVNNVSYRKHYKPDIHKTPELAIIQDADRLDAIGAIGIARAFSYSGYKNRPFYKTENAETENTLHHFEKKLLKLSQLMNTEAAKVIAKERHAFMLSFLDQFSAEINPL